MPSPKLLINLIKGLRKASSKVAKVPRKVSHHQISKEKKAKVLPFESQGLKIFRKEFSKSIATGVAKKQAKVEAYPDWKWSIGNRVYSPKTKNTYEITAKSWHTQRDEPLYHYKNLLEGAEEKGALLARQAEKDLILLSGPKKIVPTNKNLAKPGR